MAKSTPFTEHVAELLAQLKGIRIRPMFGGFGVYQHEQMFGLIDDDTLYFRTDEQTVGDYTARKLEPWTYTGRNKKMVTQNYRVPEECLDDPEVMTEWATKAIAAAKRKAAKRQAVKRKPTRAKKKATPLQAQAAKGATIVGICAGTLTLSAAGLLANRSATGHWYDIDTLRNANPTMRWVRDRRYVADRNVITTTGVSASLPVSIALVEALAGREHAARIAEELGVESWDARHDSEAFRLDATMRRTALANKLAFWRRETYVVAVTPGVDDIALAFAADAWSRTFRSQALTRAERDGAIRTRNGLELLPDVVGEQPDAAALPPPTSIDAGKALPAALADIAKRYGDNTAAFVALQLEYTWRGTR